jgi:hypothetical protein
MPLETMSAALARLEADGYTDEFRAVADGLRHLHDDGEQHVMAPEDLTVREVVRFEGASDPDEEAAVFALECDCGIKGTYVVTYGPGMPPEDNDVVLRLNDGRQPPRAIP